MIQLQSLCMESQLSEIKNKQNKKQPSIKSHLSSVSQANKKTYCKIGFILTFQPCFYVDNAKNIVKIIPSLKLCFSRQLICIRAVLAVPASRPLVAWHLLIYKQLQFYTALHCTLMYCTSMHCLYFIVLFCTAVYCSSLHCTVLRLNNTVNCKVHHSLSSASLAEISLTMNALKNPLYRNTLPLSQAGG